VTASPVSSIVYNVTGTDTHGCQDNASRTVFVNPLPDAEISPAGTFDLCEGETLTLSTYPYDDFVWSTGETTTSIEIEEEGEYTVTVANSCGITTSESVIVHLTNLPPEPVITIDGSDEICEGESVTLTSSIATGNVWNTGETTTSIIVSEPGDYKVSVSNDCGIGISEEVFISLSPAPVVPEINVFGDTALCEGEIMILVSDIDEGIVWSTGETTEMITISEPGDYFVTYTNDCGSETSEIITVTSVSTPDAPVITPSGSTTICEGESVTLTSSYATGNAWSTGEVTSSIIVSEAGIYSVALLHECGAIVSETVEIIVDPIPPTPEIFTGGTTEICSGETLTLTTDATDEIIWSTGETTNSITISEVGDYFVSALNDCGGATSVTVTITTSEPPPVPDITSDGATEFCEGESVILTSSNPSGNVWSTGATSVSITVYESGVYTVTATNECGSEISEPVTVTVSENPMAYIMHDGPLSFCEGEFVILTANEGDYSYLWSTGETTLSITVTITNNYSVLVTDANGCSAISNDVEVDVFPNPPVPVITNSGSTLSTADGYSYKWFYEGDFIPGATNNFITATADGNYTVTITDGNGCSSTSEIFNYVAVGIDDVIVKADLSIFPNPNDGNYELIFHSTDNSVIAISMYDAVGKLIADDAGLPENKLFKKTYHLGYLPKGNYIVKVVCADEIHMQKLYIQ
ncbi:MAG: T9SS type A sorting domain-containing protein, partial [Chitinophagales bacterium]|nr:T9SS type A sorting domain-containing protein [Chitinophagales bacterium]